MAGKVLHGHDEVAEVPTGYPARAVLGLERGVIGDEHAHDAGRQVHAVLLLEAARVGYSSFWLQDAAQKL